MQKIYFVKLIIVFILVLHATFSGCSTAQSRRRDQRIENLERRVSKIEYETNDAIDQENDYDSYLQTAKSLQKNSK
ncbi:MAG: hypothetical protein LBT05_13345 [Planctomycetaceae bacterium]|nr:hypothetical protein [Planctomycetaceae bacterium]